MTHLSSDIGFSYRFSKDAKPEQVEVMGFFKRVRQDLNITSLMIEDSDRAYSWLCRGCPAEDGVKFTARQFIIAVTRYERGEFSEIAVPKRSGGNMREKTFYTETFLLARELSKHDGKDFDMQAFCQSSTNKLITELGFGERLTSAV